MFPPICMQCSPPVYCNHWEAWCSGVWWSPPLRVSVSKPPVIISETRLTSAQQICRSMYHASICRRDIWENCFVEATCCGLASFPASQSRHRPIQWCFLELFVIFVYKREEKKLFQNDLNECIFVYVHEKDAIQRSMNSSGEDGEGGESWCVWWPFCVFFCWIFCVFIFSFVLLLLSLLHHIQHFLLTLTEKLL